MQAFEDRFLSNCLNVADLQWKQTGRRESQDMIIFVRLQCSQPSTNDMLNTRTGDPSVARRRRRYYKPFLHTPICLLHIGVIAFSLIGLIECALRVLPDDETVSRQALYSLQSRAFKATPLLKGRQYLNRPSSGESQHSAHLQFTVAYLQ